MLRLSGVLGLRVAEVLYGDHFQGGGERRRCGEGGGKKVDFGADGLYRSLKVDVSLCRPSFLELTYEIERSVVNLRDAFHFQF